MDMQHGLAFVYSCSDAPTYLRHRGSHIVVAAVEAAIPHVFPSAGNHSAASAWTTVVRVSNDNDITTINCAYPWYGGLV